MKKLRLKKWTGTICVVLGVVALVLSYSIRRQIDEKMGEVHSVTEPLSHGGEPGQFAGGMVEKSAENQAAPYSQGAEFLTIGGVVLVIIGGCLILLRKKKK